MKNFFTIKVKAINNELQEFPPTLNFNCEEVVPLGPALVREFDANECIHVWKVFNFKQGLNIFGTEVVKTMAEWRNYFNTNCKCCPAPEKVCGITINGCVAEINGCVFTINGEPDF